MRWLRFGCMGLTVAMFAGACGSDDKGSGGTGGGGPSSGGGGAGGSAGSGAVGGSAGSARGGTAGSGGNAGKAETAGGAAGEAGVAGEAGAMAAAGAPPLTACATKIQSARLVPANLLFVIDKSGSMNCNPPQGDAALNARCAEFPVKEDTSKPSKWEIASGALSDAIATLSGQTNVSAGLTLFPQDDHCGVSADPAVDVAKLDGSQQGDITSALERVSPSGDTPIAGATILGYQHLSDALRAGKLRGNSFIVLMTDGAETCKESELSKLVETDVPHARLFNIRTFVIGAPGSEAARSLLSQIAYEGGTAATPDCDHSGSVPDQGDCHFDMTTSQDFAKDLNAALQKISHDKVLSCEFDVPTNPDGGGVDRSKVNVTFKPGSGKEETIKLDDTASCDQANGWQYSEDGSKIELCGAACDRVESDPDAEVRIALGCPTIKVVR